MVNPPLRDYVRLTTDPQVPGPGAAKPGGVLDVAAELTRPPMDDKRVRQALNYAIDRQRMVDTVLLGTHQAAGPALAAPRRRRAEPEKNAYRLRPGQGQSRCSQQAGATNWTLDLLYSAVSHGGAAGSRRSTKRTWPRSASTASSAPCNRPRCSTPGTRRPTGLYFASDPWANLEPVTQFTSGSTTNYRGTTAAI